MAQSSVNSRTAPPLGGEYGLATAAVTAFVAMMAVLWFVASPIIGRIYLILRAIETGGLWLFSGWGRYFRSVPHGRGFQFSSIYWSSVPFNLTFAVAIFLFAFLSYRKVSKRHIDAFLKSDKPLGYQDLMRLQAPMFPANEFFLLYPMSDYPFDRGPARMPMTALDYLLSCDAIVGIHDTSSLKAGSAAPRGWAIEEDVVTERLISVFGPPNPFARRGFGFTNREEIAQALDALPWHVVSVVYACVERIYAMVVLEADEEGLAKAYGAVDEFLKDIWRRHNADKRRMKNALTLGYVDEDDRELKLALLQESDPKGRLYTFVEFLDEEIDFEGARRKRADTFKTTCLARARILTILTDHLNQDPEQEVPFLRDGKGRVKRLSQLSQVERKRFEIYRKNQVNAVTGPIREVLSGNAYAFGLCASLLTQTRKAGILPPALFRWMRFYDYPLWSFLRGVGMNTPTCEVCGMFDHYQVEQKARTPLARPYLTSAVDGIRVEASKYITDDMRQSFGVIRARNQASGKAVVAARTMARSIAELVRSEPFRGLPEKVTRDAPQ